MKTDASDKSGRAAHAPEIQAQLGDIDWGQFDQGTIREGALVRPMGLRVKTSRCCGASVTTSSGGVRREICSRCGATHSEPKFR